MESFCVTGLGGVYLEGLIHGGAYFRNFTVYRLSSKREFVGWIPQTGPFLGF